MILQQRDHWISRWTDQILDLFQSGLRSQQCQIPENGFPPIAHPSRLKNIWRVFPRTSERYSPIKCDVAALPAVKNSVAGQCLAEKVVLPWRYWQYHRSYYKLSSIFQKENTHTAEDLQLQCIRPVNKESGTWGTKKSFWDTSGTFHRNQNSAHARMMPEDIRCLYNKCTKSIL